MSSYLEFYIKQNDGKLKWIGTYSRSSVIYQSARDVVPYGTCEKLTEEMLNMMGAKLEHDERNHRESIEHNRQMIDQVSHWNNPLSEKVEQITICKNEIEDSEYELSEVLMAHGMVFFLSSIIDATEVYCGIDVDTDDEGTPIEEPKNG